MNTEKMNSVVINQYKRRNFIDEAVASIPKGFEIVAVTDFEYKECNTNIVLNDSAVGTRYKAGLEKASGAFIYLLDDDDFFTHSPPLTHILPVTKTGNVGASLADVIRYHFDWHISQYCLRKDFADVLPIEGVKDSLDKVIFFYALGAGIDFNPLMYVHKRNHRNSKTSQMDKKAFYASTARTFKSLVAHAHNDLQREYARYNYSLNLFLSGNPESYSEIKTMLPLSRRIYYSVRKPQ